VRSPGIFSTLLVTRRPGFVRLSSARYWLPARRVVAPAAVAFAAVLAATVGVSSTIPGRAWLIVVLMVGFTGSSAVQFNERLSTTWFVPGARSADRPGGCAAGPDCAITRVQLRRAPVF
jgi:hypothetical protein